MFDNVHVHLDRVSIDLNEPGVLSVALRMHLRLDDYRLPLRFLLNQWLGHNSPSWAFPAQDFLGAAVAPKSRVDRDAEPTPGLSKSEHRGIRRLGRLEGLTEHIVGDNSPTAVLLLVVGRKALSEPVERIAPVGSERKGKRRALLQPTEVQHSGVVVRKCALLCATYCLVEAYLVLQKQRLVYVGRPMPAAEPDRGAINEVKDAREAFFVQGSHALRGKAAGMKRGAVAQICTKGLHCPESS